MIKTLIIPDVHGRKFWKSAVTKLSRESFPDIKVIFLGDYVDPYTSFERITPSDALDNFKEILEYAKQDDRVVMLLGNHDLHYMYRLDKCRIDYENFQEIRSLLESNFSNIDIAYSELINGREVLYTHAGVTRGWLEQVHKYAASYVKRGKVREDCPIEWVRDNLMELEPTAEQLNNIKSYSWSMQSMLFNVSWLRGGDDEFGSCIWADLEEHEYEDMAIDGVYQVFGHTLGKPSIDEAKITDRYAMLDSRCAWVIDDSLKIYKMK